MSTSQQHEPEVVINVPQRRAIEILELSSGDDSEDEEPLQQGRLVLPKNGRRVNGTKNGKGKGKETDSSKRRKLSSAHPAPPSIDLTASSSSPSPAPTSPTVSATSRHSRSPSAPSEDLPAPLSHLTCPICLGAPTPIAITKCGHVFCAPCLHSALVADTSGDTTANALFINRAAVDPMDGHCPICRVELKGGWGKDIRGVVVRTEREGAEVTKRRERRERERRERWEEEVKLVGEQGVEEEPADPV